VSLRTLEQQLASEGGTLAGTTAFATKPFCGPANESRPGPLANLSFYEHR